MTDEERKLEKPDSTRGFDYPKPEKPEPIVTPKPETEGDTKS